jgi:hypothetical protein
LEIISGALVTAPTASEMDDPTDAASGMAKSSDIFTVPKISYQSQETSIFMTGFNFADRKFTRVLAIPDFGLLIVSKGRRQFQL